MIARRSLLKASAALAATPLAWSAQAQEESAWARIQARGVLSVAIYNDNPPFNVKGKGIDAELARLLATQLGLKLNLLPFDADEKMGDDLRNMVWKGHYLGYGPADVLLHVPVDKPLMDAERQVLIFGPYYRERVVMARRLDRLPDLESLAALKGHKVAVAGQSLAGWLLIGADQGAYRDLLTTHLPDGVAAARLLRDGEVDAAAGQASELYSVLGDDKRFFIEALPMPRAPRDGWAVGMAVKKQSVELAQALQAALNAVAADGRLAKAFATAQVPWQAP